MESETLNASKAKKGDSELANTDKEKEVQEPEPSTSFSTGDRYTEYWILNNSKL